MDYLKIVRIIARLNIGGPAQQVVALSDPRVRPGWETLLIAGQPEPSEGDMGYLLAGRSVRWRHLPALRRSLHPVRDLRAWWAILRALFRERPDILHTHTAKAGALGRSAGWVYRLWSGNSLKMVHTFHGHVLEGYFSPVMTRIFCWIERRLAGFTDLLIAVSESVQADLIVRRIAPAGRIRVVSLGLPLESHLQLTPPQFGEGAPRIGLVGRLVPIKNHQLMLEAINLLRRESHLDHTQFLFVGDGELRAALERRAREMEIMDRVQFLGWKSQMAEVYRSLHILCLTSRNEGTPVSVIEAMAAARPVVATDVGGVRELLGKGASENPGGPIPQGSFELCERGILIRSEDSKGLAQAIQFLLKQPDLCLRLGEAGRRFAGQRFSVEGLARNLDNLYRELIS
ncbi:MAG: glycosyltransferase [Candidatus Omnitrophica bacterium]|nr:glycosyltransferase [Candidatus Omnitrophota bacterium]